MVTPRARLRGRYGAGLVAVGCLSAAVMAVLTPTTVSAGGVFKASADAAAVRTSFNDPKIVPFISGGGTDVTSPRASAAGNSLGTSQSFASIAYPGDDISKLTDLLGLFLPPSSPVGPPDIPFPLTLRADSNNPNPADQSSAAYTLTAHVSDAGAADATAISGASPVLSPASRSTSRTVVTPSEDGVKAEATTLTDGFSLPGLIDIAAVSTRATASRSGTGTLSRSTDMSVSGATVLGLPLELRNGKFVVPVLGQTVPVADAINSLPVLAPLKEQGVTIDYQAESRSPNGVTAPGIRITWKRDIPAIPVPVVPLPNLVPGQPNIGPIPESVATFTYSIGFASAQASSGASFGGSVPIGSSPNGGTPSEPAQGSSDSPNAGLQGGASDGGASGSTVNPPLTEGATDGQSPQVAGVPAASRPLTARRASNTEAGVDLADIYLVLVVAGLLAVAAGQLVRYQGVRTARTA